MNNANHPNNKIVNKNIFEALNINVLNMFDGNSSDSRERRDSIDSSDSCDSYSDNYDNCNLLVINKSLGKHIILNPNDPDYQIELFWYGLKDSMINFYRAYRISATHIDEWCNHLNKLKLNKKYDDIELNIRDYISQYAFQLARQIKSNYHDQILISNIKRWDKISTFYKFKCSEKYNKIILLFYIYNEIKQDAESNYFHIIKSIDYTNTSNDFDSIIYYAVNFNKSKILEKLRLVPGHNIINDIKRLYPYPDLIVQDKNIKMNKLCALIKRYLSSG
jgi:hypothetical protein